MWAILLTGLLGCTGRTEDAKKEAGNSKQTGLTLSPAEKKLLHYWDGFNFNDTVLVTSRNIGEQKLVDFMGLLPSVHDSIADIAIKGMLKRSEVNQTSFQFYIRQYDRYLYDPNSQMLNERYYRPVLEYLVHSNRISDVDKIRYTTLLQLVRKNEPGKPAADFSYISKSGQRHRLYEGKAGFKMVIFYDPTCPRCHEQIKAMKDMDVVNELIARRRLEVMAIFPQNEFKLWKEYQDNIPANWLNGYDDKSQIVGQGLYSIRAYPTIYLLDKNNKVILKDTPVGYALHYITTRPEN